MAKSKNVKMVLTGIVGLVIGGAIIYGAHLGNKQAAAGHDIATSDDGLIPIRTVSQTACGSTPWVVTDQLGFFKKEGLKVVYTGDTQPNQIIQSVLNGNNDVASSHPNGLAVAIAGGAKIKGVVKGGIDPKPEQDPKLRHMFWYINPNVTPTIHSFADLNSLPGRLKFSVTTNNSCSDFLANNIADSLDAGLGVSGGVGYYYFTTDFIEKNPEIVQKFARAMVKGQRWANEHPEEARKMTEDWIKVPVNATHYYAADSEISEDLVVPWIEDLENAGVIPKGKVKVADLVNLVQK